MFRVLGISVAKFVLHGALQKKATSGWTGHTMARLGDLAEAVRGFSDQQEENMLISRPLLLMASSLALATPTLAQGQAVHGPDGLPLGRHGPQKVPQSILDAQQRWIELEAVPRHHEVQGREAPARDTPQRFAAPANPKAAASRAAPQASDSAPAIPSAKAVATKRVVPAVQPKVVVIDQPTRGPSSSWLADFWKNQERQSGGGGSEGGGSGGGGGGQGY
jgi:hypothetical protein